MDIIMQILFSFIVFYFFITFISIFLLVIKYWSLMRLFYKLDRKTWEYLCYFDKRGREVFKINIYPISGFLTPRAVKFYFNNKKSEYSDINNKKTLCKRYLLNIVTGIILLLVFIAITIFVGFKFCE